MMQKLSTLAWRYVFWRAKNDFTVTLLKKVLPGFLLVTFFISAFFNVLPQSSEFKILYTATMWLAFFIYDKTYGEYAYKQLNKSYRPRYYMSLNWELLAYLDRGGVW